MIVDGHLDIAWNALAEGRGFDQPPPKGWLVSREALSGGGVGLVFPTIYTMPKAARRETPNQPWYYSTPREADLMGRAQVGYYRGTRLLLIRTRKDLVRYRKSWQPGQLAGVLLMESADPIMAPKDVGEWADMGVRIIGPAWMRTRYCGGTGGPGGLTALGRGLLREMAKHKLILDLSHMADRSWKEAFELWKGPIVATHGGARALCPGQRQFADEMIAEVARRDGIVGISFYAGHLKAGGRATVSDIVEHARHFARAAGDPRFVALGSDLDGGFGRDKAAINDVADFRAALTPALDQAFSPPVAEGILGGNWLRFLEGALP